MLTAVSSCLFGYLYNIFQGAYVLLPALNPYSFSDRSSFSSNSFVSLFVISFSYSFAIAFYMHKGLYLYWVSTSSCFLGLVINTKRLIFHSSRKYPLLRRSLKHLSMMLGCLFAVSTIISGGTRSGPGALTGSFLVVPLVSGLCLQSPPVSLVGQGVASGISSVLFALEQRHPLLFLVPIVLVFLSLFYIRRHIRHYLVPHRCSSSLQFFLYI